MTKVITYGTYDLLHYGHIRLLERAKALGDYLIVGVTADDFDKLRGKINVQQSLMERIEAVRITGIADLIIVEEYEGQKIDDIKRYDIDIFTVGSDWTGKFDYLNEYCKVIYLERTEGISSTKLRTTDRSFRLGLHGDGSILKKYRLECSYINGMEVSGICTTNEGLLESLREKNTIVGNYDELLSTSDAVYIVSHPTQHYQDVKKALLMGKHVLCESPIALNQAHCLELFNLAKEKELVLMESLKTAYATAYNRLLLLIKSGKIGRVVSVDATCTSLRDMQGNGKVDINKVWNSICAWGPTAMLPIFQIFGTAYDKKCITSCLIKTDDVKQKFDLFTKIDFTYHNAVASAKVGKGVKSEGELIVSGTNGYVYVPAPWWKTDYFEIRYENPAENKRYFYQLEGEGVRYELLAFLKSIQVKNNMSYIELDVTKAFVDVINDFEQGIDMNVIERF